MDISKKGIDLIASFEGCRLEAYQDVVGVWTIGYGHTAGVKPGDKLASVDAAKDLLKTDVKKYSSYVEKYMANKTIKFSVNQNMFDALTSFAYNVGAGNLSKLCKDRVAMQVADAILKYNKAGGKVLKGLTRRREAERSLFMTNSFPIPCGDDKIQLGSKGEKVKWIQQQLVFKLSNNISVDGDFGPKTDEALKKFQLEVMKAPNPSGIAGDNTIAKLK